LEYKLNKANDQSTKSVVGSKELSAKTAYNDARKAQKLTGQLKSNKQKTSSLESDIEKSKAKIAKRNE